MKTQQLNGCCDKPDPWMHMGRWRLTWLGTSHLGVCVRCGALVDVDSRGIVTSLTPHHVLVLRRNYPTYYRELMREQRAIRRSIVNVPPPPGVLARFALDLEALTWT